MPTLADIAAAAGAPLPPGADPARPVAGVATLAEAGPDEVTSLGDAKYARLLADSRAGVVVRSRKVKLPSEVVNGRVMLDVDDAELALVGVLRLFEPPVPVVPAGVHPTAVVADSATLGEGVGIGPNCYVGEHVTLGDDVRLHANVSLFDHARLGDGCVLWPGVVVRDRCVLGRRVVIHPNAVIGADGFGYTPAADGRGLVKVPQIGTVEIGDDVEIGAGACIDRAKLSVTRIGPGTKIDNLVQVGHNVEVGPGCVLCGQTGIAGSTVLGAGVVLGGQNAVNGHITIGDGVMAAARSAIAESIPAGQRIGGQPAMNQRQHLREQAATRKLPELVVRVRKLEEQLAKLTQQP